MEIFPPSEMILKLSIGQCSVDEFMCCTLYPDLPGNGLSLRGVGQQWEGVGGIDLASVFSVNNWISIL